MKKIHLDLDRLGVESFHTVSGGGARGTVRAHSDPQTYWQEYTCGVSCNINNCRHTIEFEGCSD
jgi:hypothetical protein